MIEAIDKQIAFMQDQQVRQVAIRTNREEQANQALKDVRDMDMAIERIKGAIAGLMQLKQSLQPAAVPQSGTTTVLERDEADAENE